MSLEDEPQVEALWGPALLGLVPAPPGPHLLHGKESPKTDSQGTR